MGTRIKERREQLSLSQVEVAAAVGCSRTQISYWETGHTPGLKADYLFGLAKALKVSVEWLYTGKERPVTKTGALSDEALKLAKTYDGLPEPQQEKLRQIAEIL